MQYATLLVAASAALVSSATVPAGYKWDVANWDAGCDRTCVYTFNIFGAAAAPYPSFVANCSGSDDGSFSACKVVEASGSSASNPAVWSLVAPNTGDGAPLQVSLLFKNAEDGLSYNVTGASNPTYNKFVAPLEYFQITPTDVITA